MTTLGLAALLTLVGIGIVTVAGLSLAMAQARIGLMLYAGASEAAAGSQGLLNLALAGTRLRFAQAATGAKAFFTSLLGAVQLKLAALHAGGLSGALTALRVGFMSAARAAWTFTASLLTNPVFLLVAAVVALGAAFIYAWRRSDEFRAGIIRSLQPIVTAWRGLMAQIAPLGELFGRVARAVGVSLDSIRHPLEQLGHIFFFTLGFILGATTIIFARITSNVINGFTTMLKVASGNLNMIVGLFTLDLPRAQKGAAQVFGAIRRSVDADLRAAQGFASRSVGFIVRLFGGDVPKAQAVVNRVFGNIRTTISNTLAGVENLVSGALGFIISLFRGDLEAVRTSAAQIWQGVKQVFTPQIRLGGFVLSLYRRGLAAAGNLAQTWNRNVRNWVGEQFETARARTGALLNSLGGARRAISVWHTNAQVWLAERFRTAAANFAPLLRSLRSGITDGRTLWRQFKGGVTQTFFLPWLKNEKLRSSLIAAREIGANIWERVTGQLVAPFSLARAARANFDKSLTAAEHSGGRIWSRILGFFSPFNLPGVGAKPFQQGLWSAEGTGKRVWGRVTALLKAVIPIPSLDWSAVESSLTSVLETIQGFGPQMLEAGKSLIGNLIDGFNSRIKELTSFLDKLKFPWQKDKGGGGSPANPAGRVTPNSAASAIYTPPANRAATPAAMRLPGVTGPQLLTPDFYRSLGTLDPASQLGQMLAVGFAGGILNNQDVARYAARSMAAGTIDEVRQKLQIRSPSRVFAGLGAFIPQGLGQGITSQRSAVTKAMQTLAAAAVAVPITPALAMPEAPSFSLGSPPPLTRPAAPTPNEPQTRTSQGAGSGQTVHKHYSFAGANFNLDMSEINGKENFVGKLEQLFEWFGEEE